MVIILIVGFVTIRITSYYMLLNAIMMEDQSLISFR